MAVDGMKENGKRMSWKRYKEKFQQEGWYDIKKFISRGMGHLSPL
jgi:hypothetical protein